MQDILNEKPWELASEGVIAQRIYDDGNVGFIKLQPEDKTIQGKLILGANWAIEDDLQAIYLESEELLLLKNAIDVIGNNFTENDYVMSYGKDINKLKKYPNGTMAVAVMDEPRDVYVATVFIPLILENRPHINYQMIELKTNNAFLIWTALDLICTTEEIWQKR